MTKLRPTALLLSVSLSRRRSALSLVLVPALLMGGLSGCKSGSQAGENASPAEQPVQAHVSGTFTVALEGASIGMAAGKSVHTATEAAGRTLALAIHPPEGEVRTIATSPLTSDLKWLLPLRDVDREVLGPVTQSMVTFPDSCDVQRQSFSDPEARVAVGTFVADLPHTEGQTGVPGHEQENAPESEGGSRATAPEGYERLGMFGTASRETGPEGQVRLVMVGHQLRFADRDVEVALLVTCQDKTRAYVIDQSISLKAGWNLVENRSVVEVTPGKAALPKMTNTLRSVPLSTPVRLNLVH
ncbi:hypothetical protein [Deinococcus enclensis]|uniref:Lipoprotein n=1 Tax=Deinococcus enclensis TaxID=1049582 RepID=A0ABT9MFJ6_9DEIO|nr:hypothetical protein [Deinococcus enclensis]MDP9765364.1 hypothetical protein [Deinococcus enclensis]